MSHWYERLRTALKHEGLTFEDVARHLGITRSAVGHYLRGTREPSVAQIKSMCELAKRPLSEIVGDDALFIQKDDERQVIEKFRQLNAEQRQALQFMLDQMRKSQ